MAEFAASQTACRLDANRPGLRPWARDLNQDEADMIGLATEREITSIPKIEPHVHFGGNFSEAIALELARWHGLDSAVAIPLEQGRYPTLCPVKWCISSSSSIAFQSAMPSSRSSLSVVPWDAPDETGHRAWVI